jgi:NAD(P)H-dependent FMN reductase
MKIVIVSGSHRLNSESERVANYIKKNLNQIAPEVEAEILALTGNPIPLFDEKVWSDDPEWKRVWGPYSNQLKSADGFVIISPEWGGMVPPGLKNLFILSTRNELSHKPALIVTVSSGMGGAYPVAELRTSSYKNSRICYLPEHVIIRQSGEMLKEEKAASKHDENLRKRIEYNIKILLEYTKAMQHIKSSPILDYKNYPYGM